MLLYELAVDPTFLGRGCGTALVKALAALARERNCYGMWVLTDCRGNVDASVQSGRYGLTRLQPV